MGMAIGLASAIANSMLNALGRNVAWTQPSAFWVKLHTGDPGSAGTSNAAGNTTRKQATFSAASAGSMTTSADLAWTSVGTAETYSHVSFWDASSGGTFLGSDDLAVARTVAVGDNFTILAGSVTVALTPIAA
jgi:hypothetical protein